MITSYLLCGLFIISYKTIKFNLAILLSVFMPTIKKLIIVYGSNLLLVKQISSPTTI